MASAEQILVLRPGLPPGVAKCDIQGEHVVVRYLLDGYELCSMMLLSAHTAPRRVLLDRAALVGDASILPVLIGQTWPTTEVTIFSAEADLDPVGRSVASGWHVSRDPSLAPRMDVAGGGGRDSSTPTRPWRDAGREPRGVGPDSFWHVRSERRTS